jgi:hypothetical protein
MAGLGLHDPYLMADAALLSSMHSVAKELYRLSCGNNSNLSGPLFQPNLFAGRMLSKLQSLDHLSAAKQRVDSVCVRPGAATSSICPPISQIHLDPWPTQRALSECFYRPELIDLKARVGFESRSHEAWIRSCENFGASLWIRAVPSIEFFKVTSQVYAVMLQYYMAVSLPFVNSASVPRCGCDNQAFDESLQFGFHWDSLCAQQNVFRGHRHDLVRDIFYRAYKEVGAASVIKEPLGLYANSNARPADILVTEVTNYALDFVVTNPRSKTAISKGSDKCSLLAADMAEKAKEDAHVKMVDQFGLGFLDFQKFGVAFESSGAFGKTALKVWDRLKYMAAEVGLDNYVVAGKPCTWSAFTFEQMIPQKVSWVIMRQNANAIVQGVQRSMNGIGVQCLVS